VADREIRLMTEDNDAEFIIPEGTKVYLPDGRRLMR
jgi:hypothetical protein